MNLAFSNIVFTDILEQYTLKDENKKKLKRKLNQKEEKREEPQLNRKVEGREENIHYLIG